MAARPPIPVEPTPPCPPPDSDTDSDANDALLSMDLGFLDASDASDADPTGASGVAPREENREKMGNKRGAKQK